MQSAESIIVLYDVQRPDTLTHLGTFWLPLIEANARVGSQYLCVDPCENGCCGPNMKRNRLVQPYCNKRDRRVQPYCNKRLAKHLLTSPTRFRGREAPSSVYCSNHVVFCVFSVLPTRCCCCLFGGGTAVVSRLLRPVDDVVEAEAWFGVCTVLWCCHGVSKGLLRCVVAVRLFCPLVWLLVFCGLVSFFAFPFPVLRFSSCVRTCRS